jgi:hypothetical protein
VVPRFSRVSGFILFGFFLTCFFAPAAIALEPLGPVSSYSMEEYWYWPTYHPTVESALGALKNLQGKVVGWQGSYVTQWDADAFGVRALGTVVEVQQNSLFFSNTVQVPQVESTVIPFEEVTGLHLVHVYVDRQFTLGVRCDLKNEMKMFRVADYGTATQVYNALASLVAASGRSIAFPTLGVYFRDITEKDLWIPGLKEAKGMIVTMVMKGSPAEKGDLRVRDAVVLCNDQPVENFAQWSEKIKPGAKSFDFKVLRKSTPPAVCHVVLPPDDLYPKPPQGLAFAGQKGPAPAPAAAQAAAQPAASEAATPPKMGFSLRYPNETEKSILGGRTGAVIVEVAPEGLAAKALLKAGDILLECNGKPIPAPEGLGPLLVQGENVFLVKRNGQEMTVKVGSTLVSY